MLNKLTDWLKCLQDKRKSSGAIADNPLIEASPNLGSSEADSSEQTHAAGSQVMPLWERQIQEWIESKGDRSNQSLQRQIAHCENCHYYCGKTHNSNYLHCAVHPHKPQKTLECLDYAS
jgi:hypothetical protein